MWELDSGAADVPAALRALCAEVGGEGITPGVNCGGMFAGPRRPALPSRALAGWGKQHPERLHFVSALSLQDRLGDNNHRGQREFLSQLSEPS